MKLYTFINLNKFIKLSGGVIPEQFGSYTIHQDTLLYQSSTEISIGKSFPQFFSFTLKGAELYLTPTKQILKYKIRREINVPIFGYNQRNQDFMRFILNRIREIPANTDFLLIKNLLNVFYGMCNNINEVISSLDFLKRNFRHIMHKVQQYRTHVLGNYSGFNADETSSIHILDEFLDKIRKFIGENKENKEITIKPSRVTERFYDTLLVCLLKEYTFCNGYYYDEDDGNLETVYNLNSIIKGGNYIVPSELCLFDGTTQLEYQHN